MDAQRPGGFDKKAFIAAVKSAIEAKSPKNLKEADDYKESGKAGEVKGEVKGLVTEGKEGAGQGHRDRHRGAAGPVQGRPEAGHADGAEQPGQRGADPGLGRRPKPAPPEQLNLAAGKHEANQEMADAEVTEQQLAKSNEPEFESALAAKQEAAAARRHRARRVPRSRSRQTIEQGKDRGRPRDGRRRQPACRAARARRWPSWSPTRARPRRRTRRGAPR